eukprot:scaffold28664_cov34-Prasinocladus_malaysianus.AAC.1
MTWPIIHSRRRMACQSGRYIYLKFQCVCRQVVNLPFFLERLIIQHREDVSDSLQHGATLLSRIQRFLGPMGLKRLLGAMGGPYGPWGC